MFLIGVFLTLMVIPELYSHKMIIVKNSSTFLSKGKRLPFSSFSISYIFFFVKHFEVLLIQPLVGATNFSLYRSGRLAVDKRIPLEIDAKFLSLPEICLHSGVGE